MIRKLVVIALALVALGTGLWLRHYLAPENVVRRAFLDAVEAFENERMLGTMMVIDRGYRDEQGQSYESLAGHIRLLHDTYDRLEMSLEPPDIEIDGQSASMRIRFVLWGSFEGQRGYILGSLQAPCTATVEWSERQQGWRITSAGEIRIPELEDQLDRARQGS